MSVPPASGVEPVVPVSKKSLDALIVKAKADSRSTRTLKCRTVAKSRFRQLNYIRDLAPQPVIDADSDNLLAETSAPTPMESLLAAFGSCFAIGIHANAVARGLPIRSLELSLEGDVNTSAGWGAGDLTPKILGFETIRVQVRIDADASRQHLNGLIQHVLLWSPVANTLHNPVHLDVTLAPE